MNETCDKFLQELKSKSLTFYLEVFLKYSFFLTLYLSTRVAVWEAFHLLPATGGDTGSHLWPVVVLREYGIPNWNFHIWSPANFTGEPVLVHYFPLPFYAMTFMSYFMPIGLAFNLVTVAPIVILPIAVFQATRSLARPVLAGGSYSVIAASLAGFLSLCVEFNNGNSMWGGNVFSVMAGQFAHQWAFVFFFWFVALLPKALSSPERWAFPAALLFAGVVMSHGYVSLFLPIVFLGALAFEYPSFKLKIARLFRIGALGSAVSAWYWWPLIDNSKWTTPYGFTWQFKSIIDEAWPVELAPLLVVIVLGTILTLFVPKILVALRTSYLFWGLQIAFAILCFFTFTRLGLVNIRAIPHLHYVCAVMGGTLLGAFYFYSKGPLRWIWALLFVLAPWITFDLIDAPVAKFNGWTRWNYGGWTNKEASQSLEALSKNLAGDFNDPRVAFEHTGGSNVAGTPRVFEMLPYFANRSVTDGVYMQSTIMAPMSFHHQASMSKEPSCPFPEYKCPSINLDKALTWGALLGVGVYIFQSKEMIEKVAADPRFKLEFRADPWSVYQVPNQAINYVNTLQKEPSFIPSKQRAEKFWKWYLDYQLGSSYLVVNKKSWGDSALAEVGKIDEDGHCRPKIDISFSKLVLHTNCPGYAHVLKFAFHDSWKASGGEDLYLISPGYLGINPKSETVTLEFGKKLSWNLAGWVTLFGLAFGLL